jgi:hypothetical protein
MQIIDIRRALIQPESRLTHESHKANSGEEQRNVDRVLKGKSHLLEVGVGLGCVDGCSGRCGRA